MQDLSSWSNLLAPPDQKKALFPTDSSSAKVVQGMQLTERKPKQLGPVVARIPAVSFVYVVNSGSGGTLSIYSIGTSTLQSTGTATTGVTPQSIVVTQ